MSYTEIVYFNQEGDATSMDEVKNAFRGAMAVWTHLETKHLPPKYPSWSPDEPVSRMIGIGGEDEANKVWELAKSDKLSKEEKIAMKSTFDNVVVQRENIPELIKAFRSFDGVTSLKEQADLIEKALEDESMTAIVWNQTSVNENKWFNGTYNETNEEYLPYNLQKEKDHWFLFDDFKK